MTISIRLTKKTRQSLGKLALAVLAASVLLAALAYTRNAWLPLAGGLLGAALAARTAWSLLIPRKTTVRYSGRTRRTTRRETW